MGKESQAPFAWAIAGGLSNLTLRGSGPKPSNWAGRMIILQGESMSPLAIASIVFACIFEVALF
jgi:hypothetical protein